MRTPRNDLDKEPFSFDTIVQFAKDAAAQVKEHSGREIPATSNTNVRPSLIPYDFENGEAAIEARGIAGWPTIRFNKKSGVLVHATKAGQYTEIHRQTGPIDEVDLDEAKCYFSDAINEGLSFGCEEHSAKLYDPESNRINRDDPLQGILEIPRSLLPRE